MADNDVSKMKVADLKKELKLRGLPTTGNKTELVERLQAAVIDGDAILDDSALAGDDILDDDVLNDDELDDETKSLLNSSHEDAVLDPIHEDAVLKTPPRSKSPEPIIDTALSQQKKVVLKRKLIIATPASVENIENQATAAVTSTSSLTIESSLPAKIAKTPISIAALNELSKSDDNSDENDPDKKSVKLTGLTAKERLEMRAKKFGAPIAGDAMKIARAERFGITATSGSSDNKNGTSVATPASVEILKKRAERFGGSVSKVMNKIENLEKLQKRQQRFGNKSVDVSDSSSSSTTATSKEYEEKARLRLERFNKAAVK